MGEHDHDRQRPGAEQTEAAHDKGDHGNKGHQAVVTGAVMGAIAAGPVGAPIGAAAGAAVEALGLDEHEGVKHTHDDNVPCYDGCPAFTSVKNV